MGRQDHNVLRRSRSDIKSRCGSHGVSACGCSASVLAGQSAAFPEVPPSPAPRGGRTWENVSKGVCVKDPFEQLQRFVHLEVPWQLPGEKVETLATDLRAKLPQTSCGTRLSSLQIHRSGWRRFTFSQRQLLSAIIEPWPFFPSPRPGSD